MKKAALILMMASLAAAAFYFEWLPDLTDTQEVRDTIAGFGPFGPIVFILLISCLNPFFVPFQNSGMYVNKITDFKTQRLFPQT